MAHTYTLWGWTAHWTRLTQPMRIMSGTIQDCRTRQEQFRRDYGDALCGIYAAGDEPEGLRLQVLERMGS